eukprot:NODE_555_length_6111_cov_0.400366.p4 type:complete len:118 gc:universal NODE_555_length_6111_cov_0.400366:2101-2454(+)
MMPGTTFISPSILLPPSRTFTIFGGKLDSLNFPYSPVPDQSILITLGVLSQVTPLALQQFLFNEVQTAGFTVGTFKSCPIAITAGQSIETEYATWNQINNLKTKTPMVMTDFKVACR